MNNKIFHEIAPQGSIIYLNFSPGFGYVQQIRALNGQILFQNLVLSIIIGSSRVLYPKSKISKFQFLNFPYNMRFQYQIFARPLLQLFFEITSFYKIKYHPDGNASYLRNFPTQYKCAYSFLKFLSGILMTCSLSREAKKIIYREGQRKTCQILIRELKKS